MENLRIFNALVTAEANRLGIPVPMNAARIRAIAAVWEWAKSQPNDLEAVRVKISEALSD